MSLNRTMALVRRLPASFATRALRSDEHQVIEQQKALHQHEHYVAILRDILGEDNVIEAPTLDDEADSVFVEDTAVVIEGSHSVVALRMGAASRRGEQPTVISCLNDLGFKIFSCTRHNEYMDGGDVLFTGQGYIVGLSSRTNALGAKRFAQIAEETKPGTTVDFVKVPQSLHLKSVCTLGGPGVLVLWEGVPNSLKQELETKVKPRLCVEVPDQVAANVLWIAKSLPQGVQHHAIIRSDFPASAKMLTNLIRSQNIDVHPCDLSEMSKADGALTCCSIILQE
jgi:dimethylargininase